MSDIAPLHHRIPIGKAGPYPVFGTLEFLQSLTALVNQANLGVREATSLALPSGFYSETALPLILARYSPDTSAPLLAQYSAPQSDIGFADYSADQSQIIYAEYT